MGAARFVRAVLLVGLLTLAGCLSQSKSPPPTPIDPLEDLVFPNSTLPLFQFSDCSMRVMVLEVPKKILRPNVPLAFQLFGFTSETVAVIAEDHSCHRTVGPREVPGRADLFRTYAFVLPTNRSWTEEGWANRYILDMATDNPALRTAFANASLASELATFEVLQAPVGDVAGAEKRIVTTDNYTASFDAARVPFSPQQSGFHAHLWTGQGPFHRIAFTQNFTFTGLAAGDFAIIGESPLARGMGSPVMPYHGSFYDSASFKMVFEGSWNK